MTAGLRATAAAKINLALVVGPPREDGLHELATVVQRVDVCDRVVLEPSGSLEVTGFPGDTIVRDALQLLASTAGVPPSWRVRLTKGIPVAAGLGGGSADAAAALTLANRLLADPLPAERLAALASQVGSDVPFFLAPGPKLVEGTGELLTPLELPQDYWVLLVLEAGAVKASTGAVYRAFDDLGGGSGFADRRAEVRRIAFDCRRPRDLAALPANDLAPAAGASDLPDRLRELGAFRADLSGAGPTVYALFHHRRDAEAAARRLPRGATSWVVAPVW
jgi:4-diphosphocytidyl-2-C-methyl-D-erythritol kinase